MIDKESVHVTKNVRESILPIELVETEMAFVTNNNTFDILIKK